MTVVDQWAGVRWRQGVACDAPKLWLDGPRPGALGLLPDGDGLLPRRARVVTTPLAAGLAGLGIGRGLRVPYGQPFQLGAGAVELLPSGASPGGSIARLYGRGRTLLVVRSASLSARPGAAPLELREADVLVLDATLATASLVATEALAQRVQSATSPQVWLLAEPLRALDFLRWTEGSARVSPVLRRWLLRAGVQAPVQPPGRRAEGQLLWPLADLHRLPRAWQDVPQLALAEPGTPLPVGAVHVPVSRRLALPDLLALVEAAACPTVLAWGEGAQALAEALEARAQTCHTLRIPQQLTLV